MVIFPHCKINLGLSVIEKRIDGFHNLETVLYPLPIRDMLEMIPGTKDFHFHASGIPLNVDQEQNLVVKAYHMIQEEYGIGPVQVHLHKLIPAGAGLGGGSSDASHALILLNNLFSLGLPIEKIEYYARKLGSDCAFFLNNKPMLADQKGDHFRSVDLDLDAYSILVVKPDLNINTAMAYSWIHPSKKELKLEEIIKLPVRQWQDNLINDFEKPVFDRHPELSSIKDRIRSMGALYTSMTGTGAAIFGIFEKPVFPEKQIDFPGCFVWSTDQ